jgi:hypothetical protein
VCVTKAQVERIGLFIDFEFHAVLLRSK